MNKTIEAVLILTGMIIGVGMFGIPFSFSVSGFWLGAAELVVLAAIVTVIHRLYGEIVLATPTLHRVPGYVRDYLGENAARIAKFSTIFGSLGALLAYLLVGSLFLQNIFWLILPGMSEFGWIIILAAAAAFITKYPLRKEALVNAILTVFLIGFIIFLVIWLAPKLDTGRLSGFHGREIFAPYGILLFALSGLVVIPDMITRLGRSSTRARSAILWGSLLPAFLYLIFAAAVIGVSNGAVSPDAIEGLRAVAGERVVGLGSIIGFLAVFTSLVALGTSFQNLLRLDFGMKRGNAWLLTSIAPFAGYLFGFSNFIAVIGTVGALAGGIDTGLIIMTYHKMRKREYGFLPGWSYLWKGAIIVIMAIGILYEVIKF